MILGSNECLSIELVNNWLIVSSRRICKLQLSLYFTINMKLKLITQELYNKKIRIMVLKAFAIEC